MTIKIYMIRERTVIIFLLWIIAFSRRNSEILTPFLELSINVTPFFVTSRALSPFIIPTFSSSIRRSRMQQTDARASKRNGESPRQPGVSGRCTPMLACQREFDAPRHPLTSFYPTSRSRVIPLRTPSTPMQQRESARSNFRPSKTGSELLLTHVDGIVS